MSESNQAAFSAFQQLVLSCNKQRHYLGVLPQPDAYAEGANPLCGDHLAISLQFSGEQIQLARYQGEMSAVTIAAAEKLCAAVEQQTKAQALLVLQQFLRSLQIATEASMPDGLDAFTVLRHYPNRVKTATLPAATLIAALRGETHKVSTEN